MSIKIITRTDGRSAVAAAAYRSGEKIKNLYDGVTSDYTKKQWIIYKEVMLPEHAPEKYRERSVLWNEVEQAEKSSRSRLAREVELALPKELTIEQNRELVQKFVVENFVNLGMCADICIHNPPVKDEHGHPVDSHGIPTSDVEKMVFQNPHAHILLTVRPLDNNGKWEPKGRVEYLCKRGDEEKGFTAEEYREAQKDGWEKQYKYEKGKQAQWYTTKEASNMGMGAGERKSRFPKTSVHGRENETVAQWNQKDRIFEWRNHWADSVNQKLKELGINERIDCRSYQAQGNKKMPTEHMGAAGKLPSSEKKEINRAVHAYNASLLQYQKTTEILKERIRGTLTELETIRYQMIRNAYSGSSLVKGIQTLKYMQKKKQTDVRDMVDIVDAVMSLNQESLRAILELEELLLGCDSPEREDYGRWKELILNEREKMDIRSTYLNIISREYGYQVKPWEQTESDIIRYRQEEEKPENGEDVKIFQELNEKLKQEYLELVSKIPKSCQSIVEEEYGEIHEKFEKEHRNRLEKKSSRGINEYLYHKSRNQVNRELGVEQEQKTKRKIR
jgi:hypothetical protein